MQVSAGGSHTHHHGLLAGVGAATAAVLSVLVLVLLAWRTVSRAVGPAATVIIWALAAAVVARVAYEVACLILRLRHHVTHPETLMRHAVRAEVIPGQVVAPAIVGIPAGKPVAALPPGWRVLPEDPDAAIAMIRAITGEAGP